MNLPFRIRSKIRNQEFTGPGLGPRIVSKPLVASVSTSAIRSSIAVYNSHTFSAYKAPRSTTPFYSSQEPYEVSSVALKYEPKR